MTNEPKKEAPRLVTADRSQLQMRTYDLESTLAEDHRARVVWAAVQRLDLSAFYDEIEARGSAPGRSAIDPKILLALWLYATSEGVGSARHLSRLCERDDAYRWICGGVEPNHHTLSDFRVEHGEKLDDLLTQVLATLTHKRLLTLKRVAQDGMRVRASAGASSFRRGHTLEKWMREAQAQVHALKAEVQADPNASTAREKAARERAAREREERLAEALAALPEAQATRDRNHRSRESRKKREAKKEDEARVSTTDPEARVMKMGDGGFRPAVNVQYATDCETRMIVGVGVTNVGNDMAQMVPMLDQIEERLGQRPNEYLVDGGYTKVVAIDEAESRGVTVYAPVPMPRNEGVDAYERKPDDTERSFAWRTRMATEEAKRIYTQRGATAETVNADLRRWRGLQQMPVRGAPKWRCVALLHALTYDVLRAAQLEAAA